MNESSDLFNKNLESSYFSDSQSNGSNSENVKNCKDKYSSVNEFSIKLPRSKQNKILRKKLKNNLNFCYGNSLETTTDLSDKSQNSILNEIATQNLNDNLQNDLNFDLLESGKPTALTVLDFETILDANNLDEINFLKTEENGNYFFSAEDNLDTDNYENDEMLLKCENQILNNHNLIDNIVIVNEHRDNMLEADQNDLEKSNANDKQSFNSDEVAFGDNLIDEEKSISSSFDQQFSNERYEKKDNTLNSHIDINLNSSNKNKILLSESSLQSKINFDEIKDDEVVKNFNGLDVKSEYLTTDNLHFSENFFDIANNEADGNQTCLDFISKKKFELFSSIANNKVPINGFIKELSTKDETKLSNEDFIGYQRLNDFLNENSNSKTEHVSSQSKANLCENSYQNYGLENYVLLYNDDDNSETTSNRDSKKVLSNKEEIKFKDTNFLNSLYSLTKNIDQISSCNLKKRALQIDCTETSKSRKHKASYCISNPFSKECLIPLPGTLASSQNIFIDNKNFIKRRNQRERIRVKSVNDGFERLRKHLPTDYEQYLDQTNYSNCFFNNLNNSNNSSESINDLELKTTPNCSNSSSSSTTSNTSNSSNKERRLSKVETLRLAINYIKHLQNILSS